MGPGERGVRVLQGGCRTSCRGWALSVSGRRGGWWGMPQREEGGCGVRDGRVLTSVLQPLAELSALPDPQLLLLLPGGHRRAGPGGLHDGGVRSGVQGGSGRLHFLRGGGKRLATVAAKRGASGASSPGASPGRGGDSGSEHQGDGSRQQTNSSGCSPPAAPRGRLITNLAGGGVGGVGGAGGRAVPPPRAALPLPAPGSTSGGGSGARLRSGAGAGAGAGAGRQLAPVRSGV